MQFKSVAFVQKDFQSKTWIGLTSRFEPLLNPFRREDWEIKMIENSKLKTYLSWMHDLHMIMYKNNKNEEIERSKSLGFCGTALETPQDGSWVRGDFQEPSSRSSSPWRQKMVLGFLSFKVRVHLT